MSGRPAVRYLFVTGGVVSSLGKGLTAASIALLLGRRGYRVRLQKMDPYLNVDAGTMSPYQHGEVYVTDDGAETDLDLGNYGRFTSAKLSRSNSITTGQVYKAVIEKERAGEYLGRTVQVVPHITNEIKQRILAVANNPEVDMTIVEIGGTVGDIESVPFLEACRQLIHEFGKQNAISIHVTLVPSVTGGEIKTKPTQHAVKELQEVGIQPDALILRSAKPIDDDVRRKISLFTNVEEEGVISGYDAPTTYEVPLIYYRQKLDTFLLRKMNVESRHAELGKWQNVVQAVTNPSRKVKIAVVGKYMELHDSYKSIWEALCHGGIANNAGLEIEKVDSSRLESPDADFDAIFKDVHGILVPGGFGERGIEGMIRAARYAREHKLPYFGICLGMQIMVIEYARNVLGWQDAHSTEFNKTTTHPVVCLLEEQTRITSYGGTMRLGAYEAVTMEGSFVRKAYGSEKISERHRHRYEVSNEAREPLKEHGLIISATTPNGELVESCEWPGHPWAVGVQFHPEFKSKPTQAHPLFRDFVRASLEHAKS
ncbi:MAG: CTP synthase [Spirochaetaceae bacterium]|nr:CTP synthase [Spirochaetaceae bacterium]